MDNILKEDDKKILLDEEQRKVVLSNEDYTLKSDISQILNDYKVSQEKKHITIKNETVRSVQECRIAKFLFIN